jgi:hypothetical protein
MLCPITDDFDATLVIMVCGPFGHIGRTTCAEAAVPESATATSVTFNL